MSSQRCDEVIVFRLTREKKMSSQPIEMKICLFVWLDLTHIVAFIIHNVTLILFLISVKFRHGERYAQGS